MVIVKTIKQAREAVRQWRREGLSVGLAPTMGYLHEGHGSLIERARAENDRVCVSIFVNPMQFGKNEDLGSYPRDMQRDISLCGGLGADLIFCPEPEEMYPEGFCSYVDMDGLTDSLCGKSRPVHFRGVCTVVSKLFNIFQPDRAYFGEKDAQQLAVIRRMAQDLSMGAEVIGCPIVRESDGLAKSSRNTYLSQEERQAAVILSRTLEKCRGRIERGETDSASLIGYMREEIESEPLARIDYVSIVDGKTMEDIDEVKSPALIALAVYIGKTRLIDNFSVL